MLKSRLIALFAFLCISGAQAVIVSVDILKAKNPKTNKEQYVYLLSDVHNSMGISKLAKIANDQRNALIKMLHKCDKNNTKVIVEDSAIVEIDYAVKTQGIKKDDCVKSITYENMQSHFDMLPCLSYHWV